MNFKFISLILVFFLCSCGVKTNPIPLKKTKLLSPLEKEKKRHH